MKSQTKADEAWATFASALATCLPDLHEDEFLIVSYKRANYYVQFAAQGIFGMRVEASCNSFIEPEAALTDEQYAMMAELGWNRATEDVPESGHSDDPDGSPNFFMDLANPIDFKALGELATNTLRNAYRVLHPGELQYWSSDLEGASIRFPTLGLKRDLKH
jgi:hypothetical protein